MADSETPLRKVVDSTIAVAFARFFMPVALAIIGWFMVQSFSDLKMSNEKLWLAFSDLTKTVNGQATDVAVLKTKTDVVQKTVDMLTTVVNTIKLKQ